MSWRNFTGQQRVVRILRQAILTDRVSHAYLFIGPKGVGKKAIAVHMAKALLCERGDGDSCESCANCRRIEHGNHPDVHLVAPEGASIKIAQVRWLQKEFAFRAVEGRRKIYIVEQADAMTPEAANSLLKFIEEPNPDVVALLLTDKLHAILPTILSRCQQVTFAPLPPEEIAERLLAEGVAGEKARIASQIAVGLDAAREICQSDWFAHCENLVIQLMKDLHERPQQALFTLQEKILRDEAVKERIPLFLDLLVVWLRDLLNVQLHREEKAVYIDQIDALRRQALHRPPRRLLRDIEEVLETKRRLERNANVQLSLEKMLLRLGEG
ncbi:DNA polymerase III subunit delta' [Bacillaceae bacterium]